MIDPLRPDKHDEQRTAGRVIALLVPLVMLVAALVIYLPALGSPWVFDDRSALVNNHHLRTLWPPSVPLTSEPDNPLVDRPLVSLTFALNYALAGGTTNPLSYRLTNVLIHVINTLLMFGLMRRTLQLATQTTSLARAATPLALCSAVVWLVHPLCTEPVIYVTQRTELMLALFYLLTLYAFARAVGTTGMQRVGWSAACVVACALGMASKEAMVGAPLVVLLYDRAYVSGRLTTALKRHPGLYVGLAATWVLLALLVLTEPSRSKSAGYGVPMGVWDYLKIQAGVLLHYVKLVFFSGDLNISYHRPVPETAQEYLLPVLAVLGLVVAIVWVTWRWPKWGTPALAVPMILAPTSSVVPIATEVGADRRMYLPAAFLLCLGCTAAYLVLLRRLPRAGATWAGLFLVLVAVAYFGAQSFSRALDWKRPVTIWRDCLTKTPENHLAHNNYAQEYFAQHGLQGRAIAIEHFKKAIALNPKYAMAHSNLAAMYLEMGQPELARRHVDLAIQYHPSLVDAYNNLGVLLARSGQHEAALEAFDQAIAIKPMWPLTYYNKADCLQQLGRTDEAIAAHLAALELGLDSQKQMAWESLGDLYLLKQQLGPALQFYNKSLQANPHAPRIHFQVGMVHVGQGDFAAALQSFEQAVKQRPDYLNAQFNAALCYVQLQQWPEAKQALEKVIQRDAEFPGAQAELESVQAKLNR